MAELRLRTVSATTDCHIRDVTGSARQGSGYCRGIRCPSPIPALSTCCFSAASGSRPIELLVCLEESGCVLIRGRHNRRPIMEFGTAFDCIAKEAPEKPVIFDGKKQAKPPGRIGGDECVENDRLHFSVR